MNWHQNPSAVDQLAASYVLGTLQGRARRRFEAVMRTSPALADAVAAWTERLVPMLTTLPPMEPSTALWDSIALRSGLETTGSAGSAASPPVRVSGSTPNSPSPPRTAAGAASIHWWRRWLAPIPAGALAMGLVLGSVLPALWQAQVDNQRGSQLPVSYVGVLATAQGKPGLIVSSLRRGKVVEVKQIAPVEVPAGRTLHLWRIDKDGNTASLGPIPSGKWVRITLSEPAEKVFFTAVELAVSIEPLGSNPVAPSQAYVCRGLCGKLWR